MALLVATDEDYDHGLREFQEALNYAVFFMGVAKAKDLVPKEKKHAMQFLHDLAKRLRAMESVMYRAV